MYIERGACVVVHTCNPNYLGGGDRLITFCPGKKLARSYLKEEARHSDTVCNPRYYRR
jgi:hypothetical protein